MKVGLLTAHASRRAAGVWLAVARLGEALSETGVDVEIFGLADRHSEANCGGGTAPRLKLHETVGSTAFGYAPRLRAALDAAGLSLLHANGVWMYPSLASLRWSRRGGRPYIVSPHGMLDPWAVRNAAWKKKLVGWWFEDAHLSGAACLHALTEVEARAIRAYGLRNPICVVPNGIDAPAPERPSVPGWAAGLDGDSRILLFLGRLHPKKGLVNLIRAWAAVQRDRARAERGWTLVVAGWDQAGHTGELKKLTADLDVGGTVRFVGPQFDGDKAASYAFADAFVLPSLSEGLPVAVLEAWSYGLPALMTDACNLPEGFAGGAALRIEPNPAAIEEGLRHLFALPEAERRDIGERGRALARERFAWSRIAEEMKSVYEWVLGGGSPPSCVATG